mmetsp:Transcript_2091/g.13547  ORF Transcript_2091/g.13547 Transcript_2091/m.13547 type:complete len:116 (-) Transcript_2091:5696-6043(-)
MRCSRLCQASLKGLPTRCRCIHRQVRFIKNNASWPTEPTMVAGIGIGCYRWNSLFLRIMIVKIAPICKTCWLQKYVHWIRGALGQIGLSQADNSPKVSESSYAAIVAPTMRMEQT